MRDPRQAAAAAGGVGIRIITPPLLAAGHQGKCRPEVLAGRWSAGPARLADGSFTRLLGVAAGQAEVTAILRGCVAARRGR